MTTTDHKYLLVLLLCGLEVPLDLDRERRDVCGLTGLSFSCFIFSLDSRSGDSLLLCRFSLVILKLFQPPCDQTYIVFLTKLD